MAESAAPRLEHLSDEEAATLPPPRRPGRRPLTTTPSINTKSGFSDWWGIGSVAFWVAAASVFVPLAQAVVLLVAELSEMEDWDLSTVLMGRGGGGLPGLQDFSSSVFWLGATVSLFALVAGLLRVLRHRAGGAP